MQLKRLEVLKSLSLIQRCAVAAFTTAAGAFFFVYSAVLVTDSWLVVPALIAYAAALEAAAFYLFGQLRGSAQALVPCVLGAAGIFGMMFAMTSPPLPVIIIFALTVQLFGVVLIGFYYGGMWVFRVALPRLSNRLTATAPTKVS